MHTAKCGLSLLFVFSSLKYFDKENILEVQINDIEETQTNMKLQKKFLVKHNKDQKTKEETTPEKQIAIYRVVHKGDLKCNTTA